MGKPRAPWTDVIYEQLADGGWHDRNTVVFHAMPTVPPGRAYKTGEKARIRQMARRVGEDASEKRVRPGDPIPVGARIVVNQSLAKLIQYGFIEKIIEDGVAKIRIRPDRDPAEWRRGNVTA